MAKKLFRSKSESVLKKRSFMISVELNEKLNIIELRAEKAGVTFPLNEHIQAAISQLIKTAERQLCEIEGTDKQVS
jgi:hypothetical protein